MADTALRRLAQRVADRTVEIFRQFPEGGVIRWAEEDTPWVVVARVEDDRSEFFSFGDSISRAMLAEMVETFDPEHRRIPVISGFARGMGAAGPGHWSGRFLPPLGAVVDLDLDRINLWARFRPILDDSGEDRIRAAVQEGATDRSIAFRETSTETGGKARLWHVALLMMGEAPGIANMPSLESWLASGDTERSRWGHLADRIGSEVAVSMQEQWRHFGGLGRVTDQDLTVRVCRAAADVFRTALGGEEEDLSMNRDELLAALTESVVEPLRGEISAIAERVGQLEQGRPAAEDDDEDEQPAEPEAKADAVAEAFRSMAESIQALTQKVDGLADSRERASAAELQQRALTALRTLSLHGVESRGKIEDRAKALAGIGEAAVVEIEATAEGVRSAHPQRFTEVRTGEDDQSPIRVDLDPRHFRVVGAAIQQDPEGLAMLAATLSDPTVTGKDGAIDWKAFERVAGTHYRLVA